MKNWIVQPTPSNYTGRGRIGSSWEGWVLFYAVVCQRGSIKKTDAFWLYQLVWRAGHVVSMGLDPCVSVAEKWTLTKLLPSMYNSNHPLHSTITRQSSMFSGRQLSQYCSTDRLRKSFVPKVVRQLSSCHWLNWLIFSLFNVVSAPYNNCMQYIQMYTYLRFTVSPHLPL